MALLELLDKTTQLSQKERAELKLSPWDPSQNTSMPFHRLEILINDVFLPTDSTGYKDARTLADFLIDRTGWRPRDQLRVSAKAGGGFQILGEGPIAQKITPQMRSQCALDLDKGSNCQTALGYLSVVR